jgi:hypothetical protein
MSETGSVFVVRRGQEANRNHWSRLPSWLSFPGTSYVKVTGSPCMTAENVTLCGEVTIQHCGLV